MNRIAVSSSNIAEVGYDDKTTTLEIQFKNQSVYQYFDVPKEAYESLKSATSVGQYFNSHIRGQFRFARV